MTVISLRCFYGTVFGTPRRNQIQFLATTLAHHTKTLYACLTLPFQHRSATKTAPTQTSQSGGCTERKKKRCSHDIACLLAQRKASRFYYFLIKLER